MWVKRGIEPQIVDKLEPRVEALALVNLDRFKTLAYRSERVGLRDGQPGSVVEAHMITAVDGREAEVLFAVGGEQVALVQHVFTRLQEALAGGQPFLDLSVMLPGSAHP